MSILEKRTPKLNSEDSCQAPILRDVLSELNPPPHVIDHASSHFVFLFRVCRSM